MLLHDEPHEGGFHLRLATLPQPLRAISLSGFAQEKDFQQSRAAGFSTHLVKPIDLARLREAIEELRTD